MADMGKMDKVKHNNNVTYRCHYHVVWCPKYRRKVITIRSTYALHVGTGLITEGLN